jgi:tRNA 2-thiouridine synthesizing protein E
MSEKNYLAKLSAWTPETASQLATADQIQLSAEHLEVLNVARQFYDQYGFSPSMRPLCKTVATELSIEKGRSIYLLQLFPGSPAKLVAKFAGLPKPKNCI